MSNLPLVSIIIPTYNRAHLIGETLDSILAQTHPHWECLVVDDGSTDGTEELVLTYVQKDSRIQYHQRPDSYQAGGNGARNYGFDLCKGTYVNWFDSDDLMDPGKLAEQIAVLETEHLPFCVCQTLVFENDKNKVLGLRSSKLFSEQALEAYIKQDVVFLTQAPVFRYDFLKAHSLYFDEDLKAAQEWEFISRVLFYAPNYHVLKQPLVFFRKHADSISHNPNYGHRKWHYFLARKKVYQFLRKHAVGTEFDSTLAFLERYFKVYFRELLFSGEFGKIEGVYQEVIRPLYHGIARLKVWFFLYFVKFTGKGYELREKIIK